jgi:sugar phosphate isomerase/epimerase
LNNHKTMRDFTKNHEWLSINTATVRKSRGHDLPLTAIIEACVQRGIKAISPWRDQVAAVGEACELNAPCLVLVVGGLPGALAGQAAHKNIQQSRDQVFEGIEKLLVYAKSCNMPLAIEPLHPMYAADRACINTLEQALDVCDKLDPGQSGALGVAVDVYHVWWDPKLQQQIERANHQRLLAFHVCDWMTPTRDLLNDRGMMGDGVIDIPKIRGWVEAQGFQGFSEVEIFSTENWWQRDHSEVLDTCIARHRSAV